MFFFSKSSNCGLIATISLGLARFLLKTSTSLLAYEALSKQIYFIGMQTNLHFCIILDAKSTSKDMAEYLTESRF